MLSSFHIKFLTLHAMNWNPFQYQFEATCLANEGDAVMLSLKRGALSETIKIPRSLLPTTLEPGAVFTLKFQDQNCAKQSESDSLKSLLESLIE